MQYSREDAEMQLQHKTDAGGLFTACNVMRGHRGKKRGRTRGFQGNLSTFELVLGFQRTSSKVHV